MADYSIAADKLQHIYDLHAADFGFSESKNVKQLQMLAYAIELHMGDASTRLVLGKYRGQDADLYFSPRTSLVIVTRSDGSVVAGFKASPAQAGYIQQTGRLN